MKVKTDMKRKSKSKTIAPKKSVKPKSTRSVQLVADDNSVSSYYDSRTERRSVGVQCELGQSGAPHQSYYHQYPPQPGNK